MGAPTVTAGVNVTSIASGESMGLFVASALIVPLGIAGEEVFGLVSVGASNEPNNAGGAGQPLGVPWRLPVYIPVHARRPRKRLHADMLFL